MPELRWTLLVLGVLFIIALAWWELRRPRQARRNELDRRSSHTEPEIESPRIYKEPTLGLPEIRALPEVRSREPVQDLPVVQIRDDGPIGLRVEARNSKAVVDKAPPAHEPPREEPSELAFEEEVSAVRIVDPKPEVASVLASEPPVLPEPIVDWPPDDKRKIVALRLVAPGGERFAGHAVRQALAAEGFLLGKFDIFHKPGPTDARAILSAASLTKPGTFERDSIDMQRFGGLNLFAVLPGPLPAAEAFDELIASARSLNARLEGALQDERGAPLTPTRIIAIRDELAAAEPTTENVPES